MPTPSTQFASDNYAPVCPEAWAAMQLANQDHVPAYGDDPWTERAADQLRATFETDAEVWFTYGGTAANSLAIASFCRSYHGVVCHRSAHIATDECGAPEFFSGGSKLCLIDGPEGKMTPKAVEALVTDRLDIHYPRPRMLSITNPTEFGTIYTPDEVANLATIAHRHGMVVHCDGARFANAVASLGCSPADLTWRAGVDVLVLGGTKNGLAVGEAVLFFDNATEAAREFDRRCKQAGQLCSKMRFLAAPWCGVLDGDAWLRHATHANAMARQLAAGLQQRGYDPVYPVQANGIFIDLPDAVATGMADRGWRFYAFIGGHHRLMCSWDVDDGAIAAFLADLDAVDAR